MGVPAMTYPCMIELLGGLRVCCGDGSVTRFRTQRTAALLAYLAYYLDRQHPREELVELLWPDVDIDSGRTSLRTCLASLRRQLQPPGAANEPILIADRTFVRLSRAAVSTDVEAMDAAAAAAEHADDPSERARFFEKAVALYRGPLLPGFYDDWAVREREHVQLRHHATLLKTVATLEQAGEYRRALEYAHRAVTLEPLSEEGHRDLMRLYAATGQADRVKRQYRELSRLLRRELKVEPSAATKEIYARLTMEPAEHSVAEARGVGKACAEQQSGSPLAFRPGLEPETATGIPRLSSARLPLYLTPFFGREQEKERILQMLRRDGARLVTISGPGGSGKTRLALEVAREMADELEDAVWFVPLADVTDAALVLDTVIRTLGLPPSAGEPPIELLADALGYRRSLLLLDNYEQLAEEGALTVCDLLQRIPSLSCLVTSRQRLDVSGERDLPLAPLPVPELPGAPDWLASFASVRLFVDRAQAVRPDFQLTKENAPAVAALCERLEGVPLALELAAAWSQVLTPGRMLARLSNRDDLLTSRRKDTEPRHRTLRATFDWSYQLLPPELQRVFTWLSVFRGGWTLEAFERVCAGIAPGVQGDSDIPLEDALKLMEGLRAHSLIVSQDAGEEMRFRMLETLREYAEEQLAPEDHLVAEERQSAYFLWLAEQAEGAMDGAEQARWMQKIERDLDNFRAVLERAQRKGDLETGLRIAIALGRYWEASGGGDEGLRWLEGLLAAARSADVPPRLIAGALSKLGRLFGCRRMERSVKCFEESLRIYEELQDLCAMAVVLRKLSGAVLQMTRDHSVAMPLLERSLELFRETGDVGGVAESLRCKANALRDRDDYATAELIYDQSLMLYRQVGLVHGTAAVLAEMGYMLHAQGQYERAQVLLQESLELSRGLDDIPAIGHALWLLGRLAQDRSDLDTANHLLDEGLALARQTGNRQQAVNCLVNLGIIASKHGDHHSARRRYKESITLSREIGSRIAPLLPLRLDGHSALQLGDYGAARGRFRECLSGMGDGASSWVALDCLEGLALAYLAEGQTERAARLYGATEAAWQAPSAPLLEDSTLASDTAALRAALGDAAFKQAWDEGRTLSLEQAIEMALSDE